MIETTPSSAHSRTLLRCAAAVSLLGHPFVLAPVALMAAAGHFMGDAAGLRLTLLTSLATIVPAAVMIARRVRSGAWTNFDVSVREHRPMLYLVALLLMAASAGVMISTGVHGAVVRGVLGALVMTMVAFALNNWLKVSLHSAFVAYLGTSLLLVSPTIAIVLLVVAPLVAVSRVLLGRHSTAEVVTGLLLGGIAGLWVAL